MHVVAHVCRIIRLLHAVDEQGDSPQWIAAFPQLAKRNQDGRREYARDDLIKKMSLWMSNTRLTNNVHSDTLTAQSPAGGHSSNDVFVYS
jgi:hypothetical protein